MINFSTLLTEDYVPGAIALGQSLYENSGFGDEIHLHILIPDGLSAASKKVISNLPITITFYSPDWLEEFKCDNKYIPKHKQINQYKFNVFRLPVNKVMFVDSDILCLGNLEDIADMNELMVGINVGKDGFRSLNNRPIFNSGLFVCEPSTNRFDELQQFGKNWNKKISRGDQPILNEFYLTKYPEKVTYLGLNWNVAQSCVRWRPNIWEDVCNEGIKFLHYTQIKPWENVIPKSIGQLYYVWGRLPKKYFYYRETQSWWHPYYKRGKQQDR